MIPIKILSQPDDTTCGPTSLHAVYKFYKDSISLNKIIKEVSSLDDGGTLAVMLANHALKRGYDAQIYTYNLQVFDPSWEFKNPKDLIKKLEKQVELKRTKKMERATSAYVKYLRLGGQIYFQDLSVRLLKKFFSQKTPILTGLSSTYLYNCKREYTASNGQSVYDDVKGSPQGHFVVLCGLDAKKRVVVADPYSENPISNNNYYSVRINRLLNSIMLGIVTYDANLLILKPRKVREKSG